MSRLSIAATEPDIRLERWKLQEPQADWYLQPTIVYYDPVARTTCTFEQGILLDMTYSFQQPYRPGLTANGYVFNGSAWFKPSQLPA